MESNRRRLHTSSEIYPASPRLEKDISDSLTLVSLLDAGAIEVSTSNLQVDDLARRELELHRMLSLRNQISTTSSDAQRHAAAQSRSEPTCRKIGAGACGAIFGQDGKSIVIKLAKTNDELALWNDYHRHTSIAEQFHKWDFKDVRIPECYYFVPKDDPHFFRQRPELAEAAREVCHLPTSALLTERILPLPKDGRIHLIDKYCAPRIKEAAFGDEANRDCLVRLYLGSMHGKSGGMFFSLRNFKMHLNQMVDLQLDVKAMAGRMGIAMAIMHWAAKTDARDIEFVLGSSSSKPSAQLSAQAIAKLPGPVYTGPLSYVDQDFFSRITNLWVLDFNQVQSIAMDEAGVAKAIEAAKINDPYLPKPLGASQIEKQAWNTFASNYISAADTILGDEEDQKLMILPRLFIRGLIELQERKK
ncbi:zinc finger domain-containing protein [Trichoderma compactum]